MSGMAYVRFAFDPHRATVRDAGKAYRSMYTTTIGDVVYILHVFVKKSQKTAKNDLEIAKKRFREVIGENR